MATNTAVSSAAAPIDMSTKLGGRVFQPALPVVDASPPTAVELSFNASFREFCHEHIPLESEEGIRRRERVLDRMGTLCRDWIYSVCLEKGFPSDVAARAGGQLFTSGSYRLGVHEPGADIDTILVAPAVCRRTDFFDTLAARIRAHPDVTNFTSVQGAAVPLLTFDWEGVNIDLLFARLSTNAVPPDFDVDDDRVLDGADAATEKSLNGPRVTNLIAAFVGGTAQRYQTFLQVVRAVRKWAKARGLYSNKMGYWGGVNINIAVALTVQLYPSACAAVLLRKCLLVFSSWRWPQPVMLTPPHDAGYGLPVWTPQSALAHGRPPVAPMITPAYPAMNSTLSVSRQTLQILQEEFRRAHAIVDTLWKEHQQKVASSKEEEEEEPLNWKKLFEPSDFFISYPRYLSVCIVGPTQEEAQMWAGFVESRLRKLVSDLLGRSLPLKKIQLWPKKLEACVADPTALLTQAQRQNCLTYWIGLTIDRNRLRGDQLNVEVPLQHFRDWDLSRFQPLVPGMDVLVRHFTVKTLPSICFEGIYAGGKPEAMRKRRELRNADPVRQEKKKLQKLEELKAKMAEMQRKKEEIQQDRKRKRDVDTEDDNVEEENENVKQDGTASDAAAATNETTENEETHLLESALDTMPGADDLKTEDDAELVEPDGYESDENAVGYTKDDARQMILPKSAKEDEAEADLYKGKRSLPVPDEVAEALRQAGFNIVSDDEAIPLSGVPRAFSSGPSSAQDAAPDSSSFPSHVTIRFRDKFDMVELDALGHVIDKGDEDFRPSKSWMGRQAGFEFKLGERGLGYYRTGKKVVVPSNTAY